MEHFTDKMTGYEEIPAYVAVRKFFDYYLIERNYEKISTFLEEDFYCVGVSGDTVSVNKEKFIELVRGELEVISKPIEYKIQSVFGKEIAENIWNVLTTIKVMLSDDEEGKTSYELSLTICFKLSETGFVVTSMHMTKNNDIVEAQKIISLKNAKNKKLSVKERAEQTVFEMMCKSMPGAIISGYAEDGYPIYFVNDQYLKLLGYSSSEEYYEAANGSGLTHIHPDDVEMVNKETMYSYSTDTQYGIEYRIRHKKGHYIHVYDVGKKMITPDKKEIIICVLYDMTEDVHLKEILIRESNHDYLTGIYNRGGGIRTIENELKNANQYCFTFFDIDNLKKLNDKYNHKVGDIALKYFADLLVKEFGEQAILARFGGDEFIAFFTERVERERIASIFSKIEQGYCDFIEEKYPESHSSVSIGCVIGRKNCNFDELCHIADGLMYDIKKNGKKGHKIIEIE